MKRLAGAVALMVLAGCGAPAEPGAAAPVSAAETTCTELDIAPEPTVHGAVTTVSERPEDGAAMTAPDAPMPAEIDLGRAPVGQPTPGRAHMPAHLGGRHGAPDAHDHDDVARCPRADRASR